MRTDHVLETGAARHVVPQASSAAQLASFARCILDVPDGILCLQDQQFGHGALGTSTVTFLRPVRRPARRY